MTRYFFDGDEFTPTPEQIRDERRSESDFAPNPGVVSDPYSSIPRPTWTPTPYGDVTPFHDNPKDSPGSDSQIRSGVRTAGLAYLGGSVAGGWGNFAAAGIGLAGDIYGANSASNAVDRANAANREMAREQMAFQERMSSTAHQREVEDLRRAGINPLMGSKFGGSSSPSGASANAVPNTAWAEFGKGLKNNVNSAMDAVTWAKDLEGKDAQIAAAKAGAVSQLASAEASMASAASTRENIPGIREKLKQAKYQTPAIAAEAGLRSTQAGWGSRFAGFDAVMNRVYQAIGSVGDAINIRRMVEGTKGAQSDRVRKEETHLRKQGSKGTKLP